MKKRNQLLALCALVILVLTVFACENPFIPGKYKEPAPPQAPTVSVSASPIGPYVKGEGVTITAKAKVGDAGELSYQWYSNTKNSNSGGKKISGATGESYRPSTNAEDSASIDTAYYYVEATNTLNGKITTASSRTVDVTVYDVGTNTPIREVNVAVNAPVKDAEPSDMVTTEAGYSCVEMYWSPGGSRFQERHQYTVTVVLEADNGYTFLALKTATINGQTANVFQNNGITLEMEYTFPEMKSADKIEIKSQPSNFTYTHGNALNLAGLVITATFNDGSVEDIPAAEFADRNITTNPADGSALSHTNHTGKPVAVSYAGLTVSTNNLTVNKAPIATIGINKITIIPPAMGDVPAATATVDTNENYTAGAVTWSPTHNPFMGNTQYTATVTLTAKADYLFANTLNAHINESPVTAVTNNTGANATLSLTFDATLAAAVTSITITSQPTNRTYTHGDTLNLAGISVTVTFNDGTTTAFPYTSFGTNIVSTPAHGQVLLRSEDNGKPVVVRMGELTANTNNLTVNTRALNVTGARHTKVYDRTTAITANEVYGVTFDGVLTGDSVTGTVTAAAYTSADVPTKTINITNLNLTGIASSNYTVNLPADNITLTGASDGITKKPLTVSASHTKGYDGNTSADGVVITLGGIISGDTVSPGTFTAAYTNSNVGAQNITITNLQLTGASAGNYSVPASVNVSVAGITKKQLTVTGASHTKVYDGTTAANGISITLGGVVPGDNITATPGSTTAYTSADAGTKTIYISSVGISGSGINNYTEPVGEITVTVSGGITKANYPSNYITLPNVVMRVTTANHSSIQIEGSWRLIVSGETIYPTRIVLFNGGSTTTIRVSQFNLTFYVDGYRQGNVKVNHTTDMSSNAPEAQTAPKYAFTLAEGGYPAVTVHNANEPIGNNATQAIRLGPSNGTPYPGNGTYPTPGGYTTYWNKYVLTVDIAESRNYFAANNRALTRYFFAFIKGTGQAEDGNYELFQFLYNVIPE